MREIRLNGVQYEVKGEITKRAVSPWMAKVSSGSREYSDFSQAQLGEFHDFRNGIGLESEVPAESNRTWWTEGIDFTTPRSAVLGPLVSTAGSFGEAPIKIFDFDGATYAIGATAIKKWNGTDTWDTVDTGAWISECNEAWDAEQDTDTICTADTSDYKHGTASAKVDIKAAASATVVASVTLPASIDLSGATEIGCWIKCSVELAAENFSLDIFDGEVDLEIMMFPAVSAGVWTHLRLVIDDNSDMTEVDVLKLVMRADKTCLFWIDAIHGDAGPIDGTVLDAIVVTDQDDEYLVLSTTTETFYSKDGTTWFDIIGCRGYLAWYDTKLRGIDPDGNTLYSSAANDIDGTWTSFTLSGNFGIVYDLFEGKLLADGTPALYFCGTEGVFTIDVSNTKAYRQEVSYPAQTYAGHDGKYWNGSVWIAAGHGILKITPSMATYIGPNQDDGLPAGYHGIIYDMTPVSNWLVYCVNGGGDDKSSILKRNSSYGGNLQVYTTSTTNRPIACIHYSPSTVHASYTNGRLWFGEKTDVKYMMFPETTSNVKQLSTYTYVDDSGYGILPIFRKLAAITKVALGVAAITKSCDSDEYIQVFYGLNGASPTTSLGTFKTSPRPEILTFNRGLGTEFYTIQFSIKLFRATANTTNSPELESLLFYYMPRPTVINAWTFNVLCVEDDAEALIAEFEAIRDTKTLVVFNPTGDSNKRDFDYNVALTTMPLRFWVENQETRQGVIQITCEEVFNG